MPVTITVRAFLQNLWKLKYDWDVVLDGYLQKEWDIILSKLENFKYVQVPRWIVHSCFFTFIFR